MTNRNPCIIPVGEYAGRIGYWLADASQWYRVLVFLPGRADPLFRFPAHLLAVPIMEQLVQRLKSIECPINADRTPASVAMLNAEADYIATLSPKDHPIPAGTRVAVKFRVGPPRIGRIVGPAAGHGAAYVVAVPSSLRSDEVIDHVVPPYELTVIED